MTEPRALWDSIYLGNPLSTWAAALASFLLAMVLLPIVRHAVTRRRARLQRPFKSRWYSMLDIVGLLVEHTNRPFFVAFSLWLASRDLNYPPRLERWITVVIVVLTWMQVALWVMDIVRYGLQLRRERVRAAGTLDAAQTSSMEVVLFVAGIVVWASAVLFMLAGLGVQIKPLLTGLGIGGIALALAVQTVLSDLLASLTIALDRPFAVGDALNIDGFEGTVEHIGVKSTRLRSTSGEQIVFANGDITKARVRNFGRMIERRALFRFGVEYAAPVSALVAIPRAVREIVEAIPDTRFDRCHLVSYDAGLTFETVYFMKRADYMAYADAQQRINLRILEHLRAMEVRLFAAAPRPVQLSDPSARPADAGGQQRLL
jgi:small-conductance mechanosensitive channel